MLASMRLRMAVVVALGLLVRQPAGEARQAAGPARSPQNASYTLFATLDAPAHAITGTGRLTWRNISRNPTSELRFHLYWNAWRDARSTWIKESQLSRNARIADRPDSDRGWIDVTKLVIAGPNGNRDLLAGATFIAPDDGNADDRTVLSVRLDTPVQPGQSLDVDLAWASHVPRTFTRTGVLGHYFFIAQWFPKIGVLEDAGWNCHQFHAATEFFSDFGAYDVSLTVPAGWIVGATGRERPSQTTVESRNVAVHRFVQQDVHDFAWTTSPDFLERHEAFDEPGLPQVDMRLLLQPEHVGQAARHFDATRIALKSYGTWFGPYPYDHITIVDPAAPFNAATQGGSSGGMEYPTLFTAGTRLLAPVHGLSPESVTIHEAGHQFWYGVVATNEFEHAWMDEGFNSYSQGRAIETALPPHFVTVGRYFGGLIPWAYEDVRYSRLINDGRLDGYRAAAAMDVQSTPTWQYWPGTASPITYSKTALWLTMLERYLGWPAVQHIMSTYYARGAFRHPRPEEFFAIANEVSGQDLTWFFDAVYRSSAVFDYGVAQVAPDTGTVIVRRYGDGVFPVDVRVTFGDGSSVIERWDGRERWHAFRYAKLVGISRVEVDPGRVLTLDVNYTNNSWTARPRGDEAADKWALRWLYWVEDVLMTYGAFA